MLEEGVSAFNIFVEGGVSRLFFGGGRGPHVKGVVNFWMGGKGF